MDGSLFGLAGVFPGEKAVFDALEISEGEQAALGTAWHVFEAAGLQPAIAEGVISRLPSQQSINIGLAEDAGIGEKFWHEVCVGFWVSNAADCDAPSTCTNRCHGYGLDIGFVIPYGAHIGPIWSGDTGVTHPYGM
jgi:hypothetical protein